MRGSETLPSQSCSIPRRIRCPIVEGQSVGRSDEIGYFSGVAVDMDVVARANRVDRANPRTNNRVSAGGYRYRLSIDLAFSGSKFRN